MRLISAAVIGAFVAFSSAAVIDKRGDDDPPSISVTKTPAPNPNRYTALSNTVSTALAPIAAAHIIDGQVERAFEVRNAHEETKLAYMHAPVPIQMAYKHYIARTLAGDDTVSAWGIPFSFLEWSRLGGKDKKAQAAAADNALAPTESQFLTLFEQCNKHGDSINAYQSATSAAKESYRLYLEQECRDSTARVPLSFLDYSARDGYNAYVIKTYMARTNAMSFEEWKRIQSFADKHVS